MTTVQVPGGAHDRPPWKRVAMIAGIGFVAGVVWPRLAGVRLGPSLPEAASAAAARASAAATQGPPAGSVPAPAASAVGPALAGGAPAPAPTPVLPTLTVASGVVQFCKTSDGDSLKGADCGKLPGLDGIVLPRLRKLAECADGADASGKLQLLVHLDFARSLLSVDLGRNPSVASADALAVCAKTNLAGVSVANVAHDNPRYTVSYALTFGPIAGAAPSAAVASARSTGEPSDGKAQVVWEVAIVRDAPKTGKVVARLQRGNQVHVGAVKDGWYPIQYGDGFTSDGWVYRAAIGR